MEPMIARRRMRWRRLRKTPTFQDKSRETQMLDWRVRLSFAAYWADLYDRWPDLPIDKKKLLAEFHLDDLPDELAYEHVVGIVRKCNWIAKTYGPIPDLHWNAARQWRDVIAPLAHLSRGGR